MPLPYGSTSKAKIENFLKTECRDEYITISQIFEILRIRGLEISKASIRQACTDFEANGWLISRVGKYKRKLYKWVL